jgi:hypothetical protein
MVAFWWSSITTNFGAGTWYISSPSGWNNNNSTEALEQTKVDKAGIISTLTCRFSANASNGTTSVTTRKNGADGNVTISIGTGLTGFVSDVVNSDTIAVDDLVNLKVINGGVGNCSISNTRVVFNSTGSAVELFGNAGVSSSANNTTAYILIGGGGGSNGTDSVVIMRTRAPATWSNFQAYFNSNARTTTTTLGTRINTTNGNQVLSVGAGLTGLFRDTTHTDAVAAGDNIKGYRTNGASAEAYSFISATSSMAFATNSFLCTASVLGITMTAGTTYRCTVSGTPTTDTTGDTSVQMSTGIDNVKFTNLYFSVNANAATIASTGTLRNTAADTSLSVSITALTTGNFEDTTNSAVVNAFNMLSIGFVTGTGGNVTLIGYSMLANVGQAKVVETTVPSVMRRSNY